MATVTASTPLNKYVRRAVPGRVDWGGERVDAVVSPLDRQELGEMQDPGAVENIADPLERAKTAHSLIDQYQEAIAELSRIRRVSIESLLGSGMTQTRVAELLGLSRSRMSQLLSAGVRPERAFLGAAKLTVAIGAKQEANRQDPGDMLSVESFTAYELLAEAARSVGLDAAYEVVPPPGLVHLNRANLIVLTNPRLLPFLSQVMEADPHLRYFQDDNGNWHLRDLTSGSEYRSLRDKGQPSDYGYVGRLPRPDGKGTFLYLAGTHAQGTLGAAHYVTTNLAELYKELKGRRFSTIIECKFDPKDPRKINSTERVTPLYKHEGS